MVLAAATGFVVGVVAGGGWPSLPPPDRFWWAAWAAPGGALVASIVAHARAPRAPRRAAWPQGLIALPLAYAVAVQSALVLGLLAAFWGTAVLGASLAFGDAPPKRAFGTGATGLVVLLGLLAGAWRYGAFPAGPLALLVLALACVSVPLPRRAHPASAVVGLGVAVGAAWWAHATSALLTLY